MFKIVLMAMVVARIGFANEPRADFQRANELYDAGKFVEAKSGYDALITNGELNANIFYNLGNAEFRLQHFPAAILAYERTMALEPNHPEARANLAVARKKADANVEAEKWFEQFFVGANENSYALCAAVAGWIFVFGLAFSLSRRNTNKELAWAMTVLAFFFAVYAASGAYVFGTRNARSVVVATQTEARFEPFQTSAIAQTLRGGSHVKILRERGAWDYCLLPDGSRRWVSSDAIEPIRLSRT